MSKIADKVPSGFKMQVFGAVLAVFGSVGTVMNIFVAIPPDAFFLILIFVGTILYFIGKKSART